MSKAKTKHELQISIKNGGKEKHAPGSVRTGHTFQFHVRMSITNNTAEIAMIRYNNRYIDMIETSNTERLQSLKHIDTHIRG